MWKLNYDRTAVTKHPQWFESTNERYHIELIKEETTLVATMDSRASLPLPMEIGE